MFYCGLDLAGLSSYGYVTDAAGHKQWSGPVDTTRQAFQEKLQRWLSAGLTVAIEAGNQTAWVYEALVELGARVVVVNPNQVKLIAQSRKKTDKVDAKILCELLRLGGLPEPVHMPGPEIRGLRGLLVARRQLINMRTKVSNIVRGLLRQEGVRLPANALKSLVGWRRLQEQGFQHDHLALIVASYFESFQSLTKSMRGLDRELAHQEQQEPRVKRLQTMPKVGRIAALTFVAAVDKVERFANGRKLVSYSGLAPIVRSSGERIQYGSISRQGRGELRGVWVQIAHLVAIDRSRQTQPLRRWYERVRKRRGQKTAVVALARRLLVIAYQLLRHQVDYDVGRLKPRRAG